MDDRTIIGVFARPPMSRPPGKECIRLIGDRSYSAREMLDPVRCPWPACSSSSGVAAWRPGGHHDVQPDRVPRRILRRIAHIGAISVPLNTSLRGPILAAHGPGIRHRLRRSSPKHSTCR